MLTTLVFLVACLFVGINTAVVSCVLLAARADRPLVSATQRDCLPDENTVDDRSSSDAG